MLHPLLVLHVWYTQSDVIIGNGGQYNLTVHIGVTQRRTLRSYDAKAYGATAKAEDTIPLLLFTTKPTMGQKYS